MLPSSALLNCTAVYLTSVLPHSGQGTEIVASFCRSLLSTCWIADRFCLRSEGKEEALVDVSIVLDAVSVTWSDLRADATNASKPLFSAPQQSQTRIVFLLPVELSRRLPQSVQKTRDPTADILGGLKEFELLFQKIKFRSLACLSQQVADAIARLKSTSNENVNRCDNKRISSFQRVIEPRSRLFDPAICFRNISMSSRLSHDQIPASAHRLPPSQSMESNGYARQNGTTSGPHVASPMNGSNRRRAKVLSVDEALPYSPFSSVVPFNSGSQPLQFSTFASNSHNHLQISFPYPRSAFDLQRQSSQPRPTALQDDKVWRA